MPSLFRKPVHQRFRVEPRYYDPVKEDIENRTSRIKAELGLTDKDDLDAGYRSQISGSFRKNMKHATGNGIDQTSVLRLIILVILIAMIGGYVYIGTEIFYVFLLYIPFYLWKKFKNK